MRDSRTCLKKLWTYMKHQRSSSAGIPSIKVQGRLITDPKLKVETLNSQFNKAFSEGNDYTAEEFARKCSMPDDREDHLPMEDITLSVEGVEKILDGLNPAKAAGPDGIPPRVLRELSREIAPILMTIYRSSLNTGVVPSDWRQALVSPVFKKGVHYNPINYRPISLTSIPCKVLEHILTSATMTHLESQILTPRQHGFRKRRSCETQLLELIDEISSKMERGIPTDVIVIDFAKAFDRVNHSLLVHKIDHYGIRGSTNRWVANFLHEASSSGGRSKVRVHRCDFWCAPGLSARSLPIPCLHK